MLVSTIVLFFLHENITILWVACAALGFFTGPIIPSAFAWTNRYIEVTAVAQMVPQIGAAVGDVIILSLLGHNYHHFGPIVIWSFEMGMAAGICLIAIIMQIFGSLHGDRYDNIKDTDAVSEVTDHKSMGSNRDLSNSEEDGVEIQ